MATKQSRMHGRVEGARARCAVPGCNAPGEFKAPLQPANFDGPGSWRFLCLDHVREHNAKYNFFEGMSPDEITEAQHPLAGWERPSRRFAGTAPTRRPSGAIFPIRWKRSRPFRAHPRDAPAIAVQQAGAAGAVGARAWRGRGAPCVAPALFAAGPPLSSRQERRRPLARGAARRGDRSLSAAEEVAGFRLVAVGCAEREIVAVRPAFVDGSGDEGCASSRAR